MAKVNDRIRIPGTDLTGEVQGFDSTGAHVRVLFQEIADGPTREIWLHVKEVYRQQLLTNLPQAQRPAEPETKTEKETATAARVVADQLTNPQTAKHN
jgi:hypothetical protein